jgi:hypothetical protein
MTLVLTVCWQVSDAVTAPTRSIAHKAQTAMGYLGSHISEALHILHDPKVCCVLTVRLHQVHAWQDGACCHADQVAKMPSTA